MVTDKEILNKLNNVLIEHDKHINKLENMLYNTFSYLYVRIDEINNSINSMNNNNNVINDSDNNLKCEKHQKNNETCNKNVLVKKHKKKRPLFYFITKHFKYKKLLEEKHLLEKDIELKQEAINKYKQEQELKRQIKIKEESKKLKQTRSEISRILNRK